MSVRFMDLRQFEKNLVRELKKEASKVGTETRREMRGRARPHKDTGDLQRSIRKKVRGSRTKGLSLLVGPLRGGKPDPFEGLKYSQLIDRGLIPSNEDLCAQALTDFRDQAGDAIERAMRSTPLKGRKP